MVEGAPGKPVVLTRTIWDRPIYGRLDGAHKLIYDTRTGTQRLYDLAADPGERDDRAAAEPILAAFLRQALQESIARLARRPLATTADQPEMTREQCENLKALGYLAANVDCAKRP